MKEGYCKVLKCVVILVFAKLHVDQGVVIVTLHHIRTSTWTFLIAFTFLRFLSHEGCRRQCFLIGCFQENWIVDKRMAESYRCYALGAEHTELLISVGL